MRQIKQILPSHPNTVGDMDGWSPHMGHINPFLLVDYYDITLPAGGNPKTAGVGAHPHTGFAPVSVIWDGALYHQDSLGTKSIVEAGGVQWMYAGAGVTHSERPEKRLVENGGHLRFIQFWVNSPHTFKKLPPKYTPIKKEEIRELKKEFGKLFLIAGEYEDTVGPMIPQSPLLIMRGEAKQDTLLTLEIPKDFTCLLYLLNGKIDFSGTILKEKELGIFGDEDTSLVGDIVEHTEFLLLAGKPLNEPFFQYGPFVLSYEEELLSAIQDARQGKMGVLIEE